MRKVSITLRELNPDASAMWAYDLNGEMTPDNIGGHSEQEAYFRCLNNPRHVFKKKITKMTSRRDGHNVGCIYCSPNAKQIFSGENDLLTLCEPAREMWDYELNVSLDPTKIPIKSSKKAYFKCKEGHSTYRKIADFYNSPRCPTCTNISKKMVTKFPNTKLFWNKELNLEMKLDDLISSSSYNAMFSCPNCHYEWKAQISHWNTHRYCPCCGYDGSEGSIEKNKPLIEKHPLITFRMDNPEGAAMWDYEANGFYTPDNVLRSSNYMAHFICKQGHKFERAVYSMKDDKGHTRNCPECYKLRKSGIIDNRYFFEVCPPAKEMWDFTLNKIEHPEKIKSYSQDKAHFICKKGHRFQRNISSFTRNPICHMCDIEKKHSIAIKRPDMLAFWDFNKNLLSPYQTVPYSKLDAFWKCKKCGYEWNQKINNRASSTKGKCPSCDIRRKANMSTQNSFRVVNPEASKLWVNEKNEGMTPDNTIGDLNKTVHLRCINNPEHIYPIKIRKIPQEAPFGCPYCLGKKNYVTPNVNDLFTVCKDAKAMWDMTKNVEYDYERINPKSEDIVWWKCRNGHEFQRSIRRFVDSQNCPTCKITDNCVAKYSHMVKQWDFKKNKDININLTSSSSSKKAWWKCKKCGYEWQAEIASRKASKGLCPCCENRTIVKEGITDLFSIVPQVRDYYDFDKNIGTNISELSVTSSTRVWWKCPDCNYQWQTSVMARIMVKNNNYVTRPCPACSGSKTYGTFSIRHPRLEERFSKELNKCEFSSLNSTNYKEKYWWNCPVCGEVFESKLLTFISSYDKPYKGCPYCAGTIIKREKSFASLHPEVMDEYSPNNIIDPYTVSEKSNKEVEWICRNNREHVWRATFGKRALGQGSCNICRNYYYGKKLYLEHPELKEYYDTEKNIRQFESYSNMSNEYVWWKCKEGHSFERPIHRVSKEGNISCPYCNNRLLLIGKNDLLSQNPELAQEFDAEKNGITADQIMYNSSDEKTWWKCKYGHAFQRSVTYRLNYNQDCPICNRSIVQKGVNDFQTRYPNIVDVWDYEKNFERPDEIADNRTSKFSFRCDKGHFYDTNLSSLIYNQFQCMVCNNKILQPGINSLLDTHKQLASEVSPNEERNPTEFFKDSAYEMLWKCPICKGEYKHPIRDREVGDDSCPYCTNRKVLPGYNSLDVIKPELIPEWSPNNEKPMHDYLATSSSYVLWVCSNCNGEYSARICDRGVGDVNCPYCSDRKVLPGFNSFAIKHAELLEEWDYINNYLICNPDTILDNNNINVWWICKDCNKRYSLSVKKKLYYNKRHMKSCTYCKGLRRKKKYFF